MDVIQDGDDDDTTVSRIIILARVCMRMRREARGSSHDKCQMSMMLMPDDQLKPSGDYPLKTNTHQRRRKRREVG